MARSCLAAVAAASLAAFPAGQALANSDDFITSGTLATPGEWPWQVRILRGVDDEKGFCGGSLIAPRWVLTAAHCLTSPRGVAVGYGDVELARLKTVAADAVFLHPDYGSRRRGGGDAGKSAVSLSGGGDSSPSSAPRSDIALVRLSEPLHDVTPVRLADADADGALNVAGTATTVIGWGATFDGKLDPRILALYEEIDSEALRTILSEPRVRIPNELRQADVDIVDFGQCQAAYEALGKPNLLVDEDEICAGVPGTGRDSCYGDSGGPLVARDEATGGHVQLGVVSWGYQCGHPVFPGIYARVASFAGWIEETMAAN